MTVLSLQWLLARPRRPAAVTRSRRPAIVTRHLDPARCPAPPVSRLVLRRPGRRGGRLSPDAARHPSRDTAIVLAS